MTSNSRFQNSLPVNILRGIIPTATLWDGTIGYAYIDDGGVFTDETTDANSAAANDVPLMPAVPVLNDAFYFGEGFSTSGVFNALKINLDTAGVGGTIAWEYYNGAAWAALAVTDATNGFTTAGAALYVTWTIPADMAAVIINGQTRYWVRARVLTAFAPIPLATQIWLGKYPTSLANITDGSMTTSSDLGVVAVGAAGFLGYITLDMKTSRQFTMGSKSGMYSNTGTLNVYIDVSDDGVTYYGDSQSGDFTGVGSTTERILHPKQKILSGRYLRIGYRLVVAGTGFIKLYEMKAYEVGA